MDFIVGLSKVGNKLVVMVIVDHLSKYAHLYALPRPFKVALVTQFLWIIFLNSMAFLLPSYQITTQLLEGIVQASRHTVEHEYFISSSN
jgi:hypothetical protein